jgi:uncharacterized cupin superfamily protein
MSLEIRNAATPSLPWPDMPINPDWIEDGNPVAKGAILVQSDDKRLSCGVWECSPGRFEWNFGWDEFARIFEGEVTIREDGGKTYTLGPGDIVHFPLGLKTHWRVKKTVRKVFFIRTPEPLNL